MAERYVLLGLALPRTRWFREVAQWAQSAAVPAEFHKCVSAGELEAQLDAGRPHSAAILDGSLPTVDRDLVATIRDAGVAPFVVDDEPGETDWAGAGAAAVLPSTFDRELLVDVLGEHAVMVRDPEAVASSDGDQLHPGGPGGTCVAVLGPGGTGASTLAMATAQGLAADREGRWPQVVLADLCRHAQLGMLLDARDVFPGLEELAEAHRGRQPTCEAVHGHTFYSSEHGYHLLLGLRKATHWPAVRRNAFELTMRSLQDCWHAAVLDCDPDLEGEADIGSPDVGDRHLMSRLAVSSATVVVVVGIPGMKGLHSLVWLIAELAGLGVPVPRLVPVVNHAPRSPKARARITSALGALARTVMPTEELASPAFVPHKRVEDALRDGVALPSGLADLMRGVVVAAQTRAPARAEPPTGAASLEPSEPDQRDQEEVVTW